VADREADVLLADGATVHLRPIQPGDADAIVALHARFSERTRYLRYFSPYPRIPPRDLERFVMVDHRDREALVAELGGQLIAVGRYERLGPGAEEAEVAFVVEDAHQGRGIGSVLLEHLAAAAAEEGITRFVAEVLPENRTMQRVFADTGYVVRHRYEDGVVHLDFAIAPTDRSREVQWEREHRTEARSIARLLEPRAVAVYGVSRAGTGVGAALLRNLRSGGFAGPVHPVHLGESIMDIDGPVDLAVVSVPAPAVPAVVADAGAAGVHGLLVVSAGFAEAGPAGATAQRELVRAAHAHGMRVIGPNSLGLANRRTGLNATLLPTVPAAGRVALFSQSAAFGIALLAEAGRRGVGLSSFVAVGNRADVSGNDLLQYWQDDPMTGVVLLYLEAFGNPRKFARLARRTGRVKPVAAVAGVRAGGFGPDEAGIAALFAQSGVIRVDTVAELFDVAVLLERAPLPAGDRVAVVTNAGPLGAQAADACRPAGLQLAAGYPVNVGADASVPQVAAAVTAAAGDPGVDALVVVCAPPLPGTGADLSAAFGDAVAAAIPSAEKPVVATFLGSAPPAAVPSYRWVEEAVRALGRVAGYARWRREPAGAVPELSDVDDTAADGAQSAAQLLAAYGIPVVPSSVVDTEDAVLSVAGEYGYPVAVKASRAPLRHRYDLGAVRLDITGPDQLGAAYRDLTARFGAEVLVQPMVAPGVACVVEVTEDPAFGPVVGFGLGGVAGELLGDRAWRTAPLTGRDAAALVRAPRAAPLLAGYRGAAPVDLSALEGLLVRIGVLVDAHPRIRSLSVNPVLARPDGYSVLHATAEFGAAATRPDTGPRRLREP
jgi:acyl-CoA synthetase (NDP forming)/GNAT superfamily N-acetyltransferase